MNSRYSFNRLWVRISLAITVVVIFATLLPMVVGIAIREFRYDTQSWPEARQEMAYETWSEMRADPPPFFPGRFVLENIAPLLAAVTILGLSVGVLLSQGLSAPLSRLAEAARAIGGHDLSQRVVVRGSQEVQEVAHAFNEMAADLEQAEALRQNLLADVAHELRTPLSVIQGNLQAILDDVFELDKAEIARLYDQTRHLSRLVDDLRELTQAEARQLHIRMIPVDMLALTANVTAAYIPIAEAAGIQFETHAPERLPPIKGDPDRLAQCLQNLLNNAFRYTPKDGQVTLTLAGDPTGIRLQISDTGLGIPLKHLPHIFDRFYRVDPARPRETGGTGLGLAITRAIVKIHMGEVEAYSDGEGTGSTFTIRLPAA